MVCKKHNTPVLKPLIAFSVPILLTNMLRSMNRSTLPMVVTIIGNCILRIVWVLTIFNWAKPCFDTLTAYRWLLASSPVTWALTVTANLIVYFWILRKLKS